VARGEPLLSYITDHSFDIYLTTTPCASAR